MAAESAEPAESNAPTEPSPPTESNAPTVPALPRDAATVVLLRDSEAGLLVWLMRRISAMVFAPNASVFPGGGVDAADGLGEPVPATAEVAVRFGITEARAATVLRTAVRETAEETIVHLAPQDLLPWTRWITPEVEPRRYDTFFFMAALPPEAEAVDVTSETVHAGWMTIDDAISEYEAGTRPMFPPTIVTLRELAAFSKVADVLAAGPNHPIDAVLGTFSRVGDKVTMDLGDGRILDLPTQFRTVSGQEIQ